MKINSGIFSSCGSDDDILSVMEDCCYDPEICEVGIDLLKTQNAITLVMEKTGYASNVCKVGIPMLNLYK